MSSAAEPATALRATPLPPEGGTRKEPGLDWALIRRQITGILRLELRRNLFSRRSIALYFLAFFPLPLFMIWTISPATRHFDGPAQAIAQLFAPIFVGYVRVVIFLSALITFMSLYRSEILERSLHYYYLTPVRRWVLVVGKYISALLSAFAVFTVATTAIFVVTCIPWGPSATARYIAGGPGLGNLSAYVGIAILACIGYGAVFLLVGLFFKNGIVPAFFIWSWEAINFVLPPLLQKISVAHYLRSLYPIPLPDGFVEVATDPTPPWISVPGLLIFTVLVLTFAGWRARRMEINYGGE